MTRYDSGYNKRHYRVRDVRGVARNHTCDECGNQASDWAQTHGTDGESPEDYRPLCRSCHLRYDLTPAKEEHLKKIAQGRVRPDNALRHKGNHHAKPCQPGCSCGKHRVGGCKEGCQCMRHHRDNRKAAGT